MSLLRPISLGRSCFAWISRRSYYVRPKKKESSGSWQALAVLGTVTVSLTGAGIYLLGRPDDEIVGLETEPDKYADRNVVMAYLLRAKDQVIGFRKRFTEPSNELLLPDKLPYPYTKPYTLVIELKDILLHSEYDRTTGWKYQKRPKLEYFFNSLVDYYEIVIFTSENAFTAHPLIEKMDPDHFVIYRLYRDSTKYEKGHHIKDLTNLNRPLNRVIMIDTDSMAVKKQPENSILLDKWTGETSDPTLVNLSSFLLNIATNRVPDVREVLDYYKSHEGKSVLDVFRENQEKLRQQMDAMESMKQKSTDAPKGAISLFSLGSASRQYSAGPPHTTDEQFPSPTLPDIETTPTTTTPTTADDNSSLVKWIGSWVGWK